MIKKLFVLTAMVSLSTVFLWANWEGNAVAGTAAEFSSGLFAASEMFPKHTIIEVINLEKDRRSRAVIVGSSGASGVLIKVSPDLAESLAIRPGETVRVRVVIPSPVDEKVGGTAYFARVGDGDYSDPVPPREVPEPVKPVEKEPEPPAQPEETAVIIPPEPPLEEPAPDPETRDIPAGPPEPEEEPIEPVADTPTPVSPEPAEEPETEPVPDVPQPVSPSASSTNEEENAVDEVATPAVPEPDDIEDPAPVREVPPIAEPLFTDEPVLSAVDYEEDEEPREADVIEEGTEEGLLDEEQPENTEAAENSPEDGAADFEALSDYEKHLVLIPAAPKEPVGEVSPDENSMADSEFDPPMKKGAFYVRAALLNDYENVALFKKRFEKQYPVTVEKWNKDNTQLYRVYIGPVKKDERGAVLETLQKLGYKDSFILYVE